MMRATTLKASTAGLSALVDYYAGLAADHLHRDGVSRGPIDYYLDPAEPAGRWWGQGRAALALAGEVQPEQLEALFRARHPGHGGRLGQASGPSQPEPSTDHVLAGGAHQIHVVHALALPVRPRSVNSHAVGATSSW